MRLSKWLVAGLLGLASSSSFAATLTDAEAEQLKALSEKTQTDYQWLKQGFKQAQKNQDVLAAITRPWEAKPWYQYQALFIKPKRIEQGVEFWKAHEQAVAKAAEQYQVAPEIIVAIIGVETFFGRFKGNYPVIDALYTLGFHYPPRGKFFRGEFASFIKLAHQQNWDLRSIKGSYAGAMGYGQFIPSSYLHYAVDFNQDGRIDMLNDPEDAIGSVANYFHQHGWQLGEPVITAVDPKQVTPELTKQANRRLQADLTWQQLADTQAVDSKSHDANSAVNVLTLKTAEQQNDYWVTFPNFYVITRYNHSPLYAMAVYQLSQRIKNAF